MVQSVLITGSSAGGLGSYLAFRYAKLGYTVFATARNPSKIDSELVKQPRVQALALDVTSTESIKAVVKAVTSHTGGKLDVLINNSGGGYNMPLADINMKDARALFDVNVWGLLEVTKEFTPLLAKAKGTIVNISSIAGEAGLPFQGVYNASKSAVTILSETMRLEMKLLGVRVVTGAIGAVKTNFFNNIAPNDLPKGSLFAQWEEQYKGVATGKFFKPESFMDPEKFAQQLVGDVEGGASGMVWRGTNAGSVRLMKLIMPTFLSDILLNKSVGL